MSRSNQVNRSGGGEGVDREEEEEEEEEEGGRISRKGFSLPLSASG